MGDWDVRDEVLLVNGTSQGSELVMFDKLVQLKMYNNRGKNLISDFLQYTDKVEV